MDKLIIVLCFILYKVLSVFHMGSSLPGKIAVKLDKNILRTLSKKYKVILITGTNGKTTTTSIIYNIIKNSGRHVISNAEGANMLSGITTLFIRHAWDKEKEFAVVEIDEANVVLYSRISSAEYIICTNIFKDQLDRYGEIYKTYQKIKAGIDNMKGIKVIANADEPLFKDLNGVYFGFAGSPDCDSEDGSKANTEGEFCIECGERYEYEYKTYGHLGKYSCKKCGHSRPDTKYSVSDVSISDDKHLDFKINDVQIKASLGGVYNIYNILAAYSAVSELDIDQSCVLKSIENFRPKFGRAETFKYNDKNIEIILVKNPVGFNQALKLPQYNKDEKCACFLLNDNSADGKDVSWIWDVDFEKEFTDYKDIFVTGKRKYDMAIRLETAGYKNMKVFNGIDEMVDFILNYDGCNSIYIFTIYTGMLEIRKSFAKRNIIRYSW